MERNRNVKALNRIFTEVESRKLKSEELDQELRDLGVDSGELVRKGMEKIRSLQKKIGNVGVQRAFNPFALAAKKRKK